MTEPTTTTHGGSEGQRPVGEIFSVEDLRTLAKYPPGEWVYFTNDHGELLKYAEADTGMFGARLQGLVESAVGPDGVMGPLYHRITDAGRQYLANRAVEAQGQ